jgi:hypothetical protein
VPNAQVCVFDNTLHMCQIYILCNDGQVSQATCSSLSDNTKCFPIFLVEQISKFVFKKSLNASMQKSQVALFFLMFGKNYPNYRKLAKTIKKMSQTLKPVSKCDKVFLPTKKKMHLSKKLQFFSLRKGNLWKKPSFIFLRVLTHNFNFERSHHETNWSDSRLGGLFYFILFLIW